MDRPILFAPQPGKQTEILKNQVAILARAARDAQEQRHVLDALLSMAYPMLNPTTDLFDTDTLTLYGPEALALVEG